MLHKRFFGYFLLLSAIVIAATAAFEAWSFRRAIDHSLHQNLLFARSVAGAIDQKMGAKSRLLDQALDEVVAATGDPKAIASALRTAVGKNGCVDGIAVFDHRRQLVGHEVGAGGFAKVEVLLPALRRAEKKDKLVASDLWKGKDGRHRVLLVRARKLGEGGLAAVLHVRPDEAEFLAMFEHFVVNRRRSRYWPRKCSLSSSAPSSTTSCGPSRIARTACCATFSRPRPRSASASPARSMTRQPRS